MRNQRVLALVLIGVWLAIVLIALICVVVDVRRDTDGAAAADELPVYSEKTLPAPPTMSHDRSAAVQPDSGSSSLLASARSTISSLSTRIGRRRHQPVSAPAVAAQSSFSSPPLRPLALPTMAKARLVPLRRRPDSQLPLIGARRQSDLMAFDPLPSHRPTNPFSTPFDDPHEL